MLARSLLFLTLPLSTLAVTYGLGQLNALTGGDATTPIVTQGPCQFFFRNSCGIYVMCNGAFKEAIGGQVGDCAAPNYGRLVFQDIGNLYIARNDDPNQVLFQSNTNTAQGADHMTFSQSQPYMAVLAANGVLLWHSAIDIPKPCCPGNCCQGGPSKERRDENGTVWYEFEA